MSSDRAPIEQLKSCPASEMSGYPNKGGLKVLPHPDFSNDGDEGLDKAVMAQILRNAVNAKLAGIYESISKAKEMRQLADMAERLGDEEAKEAARQALKGLAAAATA